MSKTLSGSAIISYGPTLPSAASTTAGALFYKTDSTGGSPQGLYMYGFVRDINPSALGSQVAQSWLQVVSPDLFVLKGGDTMTGPLTVPGVLKVTQTSGEQRLLIGNQDSSGANKPGILRGANGDLSLGFGNNWSTGGTMTTTLNLAASAGAAGITWLGNQVWHAGAMGAGSGLDADKLDGQEGAYYLNVSNMATGVLPISRGGTGQTSTVTGGIVYGASATAYSTSPAGTTGQVLTSNGAGAPSWVNQSALSVGFATNSTNASTANSATTATTATTANSVAWTGITGLNPALPTATSSLQTFTGYPVSGMFAHVRPSYFFDMGSAGASSMLPSQFPTNSLSGFDSYFSSDMGQYQVGLTVMGSGANGTRAAQISASWNFEETAPTNLRFRVNDDTSDISAWGAFRTLWDSGNLSNVSQLANDANYTVVGSNVSQFNNDAGYLTQAGASGGGADKVFWENDTVVTTNYTITAGKNAMTAGPITVNSGVTVTVPSGSVWTIV